VDSDLVAKANAFAEKATAVIGRYGRMLRHLGVQPTQPERPAPYYVLQERIVGGPGHATLSDTPDDLFSLAVGMGKRWEGHQANPDAEVRRGVPRLSRETVPLGSLRVPTTKDEAVEAIIRSHATLRQYSLATGEPETHTLEDEERLRKNWRKNEYANLDSIDAVDPRIRKSVADAAALNLTNPVFRNVVDQFRGELVLVKRDEKDASAGVFEHGPFVTVCTNSWSDYEVERKDFGAFQTETKPPEPGAISVSGGKYVATIRHEYAHLVDAAIGRDEHAAENRAYLVDYYKALRTHEAAQVPGAGYQPFSFGAQEWHERYREAHPPKMDAFKAIAKRMGPERLKNELSYYAGSDFDEKRSVTEVFAEAFTAWTHPKLDRAKFSPDVNEMFKWFDDHLTRYQRP
jgi:hypothetical protein